MIECEPFGISVPEYQTPSYEADSCPGPNNITLELGSSHMIASPMYGILNYANGLDCTWLITAPEGMVSEMTIYQYDQFTNIHFTIYGSH